MGTLQAVNVPVVVLTSHSERELSDGLKRRCLSLYLDFPPPEKEVQIIRAKVPEVGQRLAEEIARVVHFLRGEEQLRKKPSIAETLDWARALVALNKDRLDGSLVCDTLNLLLKSRADQLYFHRQIGASGMDKSLRGLDREHGRGGCPCS